MSTIKVVAKRVYPEDKIEEVLKIYAELIKATHQEEGCISYELFQDSKSKGTFIMIEEWRDMPCFKAHTVASHFKLYGPMLGALGISPVEFYILNKVG